MGNNQDNIDNIDIPHSKRSFSNNKINDNDDFQSAHIIHKLKKIKKKKMKNNYKKVKELDILTNDLPSHPDTDNTINDKQPFSTIQHIKQLIFGAKPIVEKFEDHEYEGGDTRKSTKPKKININMKDQIEELYDFINYYNTYLAKWLLYIEKEEIDDIMHAGDNIISDLTGSESYKLKQLRIYYPDLTDSELEAKLAENKKNKESPEWLRNTPNNDPDVMIVRSAIVWLECALISSFMVYNWYFAMYYANDPRTNIDIPPFSKDALMEWSKDENGNTGAFIGTFVYIFEFAFWFPEMLDWILLKIVPKTSGYLNGTCVFLLLYFICLYCTKNFAHNFKDFFQDLFTNPTGNMLINFMVLIVLIVFFHSMFTIKSSGNIVADVNSVISFATGGWLFSLLKFIFRFIITFFVSVPMGAIGCGLYLIYMSFFAISTWGKNETYQNIDNHVLNTKAGFEELDLCNSSKMLGLLYAFLKFIFGILEYFKTHLVKNVITGLLIYILISFIGLSSDLPNKLPLIAFIALISFSGIITVITSIIRFFGLNKSNKPAPAPDYVPTPQTTTNSSSGNALVGKVIGTSLKSLMRSY